MVVLSSFHREKVYDCVAHVLRVAFDECGDEHSGKAAHNLPRTVLDIVAAVQSTVSAAYADFQEKWNSSHPDLLLRLPVEIAVECFKPLPSSTRIAVSHVSRAWRRVALSEKSLWTTARISPDVRDSVTKLSDWLSRSHPLPFQLTWHNLPAIENDDVLALLIQHLGRMKSIQTEAVPSTILARIFQHPAPVLRQMTSKYDPMDSCTLPGAWGKRRAPRLKFLDMCVFAVPDEFEPLRAVRKFRGWLPNPESSAPVVDVYGGLHNLFAIFPRLVWLDLLNITDESLSKLPNLPESLYKLILHTRVTSYTGVNYSGFVQSRVPATMKRLSIHGIASVADTVDAFAAKTLGTWSMKILDGDNPMTLGDNVRDRAYFLRPRHQQWWHEEPFARRLDRLTSLVLPFGALLTLAYSAPQWDRAFPGLIILTISASNLDFPGAQMICHLVDTGRRSLWPTHATQLREVVLQVTGASIEFGYITVTFPDVLPRILTYGSPQLDTLAIELPAAEHLLDVDLSLLTRLAHCVRICDSSTHQAIAIFVDGERVPEP